MKLALYFLCLVLTAAATRVSGQGSSPDTAATLKINSRAVLVDVIVTDRGGKPVTGLKQDAFSVTEQGKPQAITFFEEHTSASQAAPAEMPKLPPDVFSNFSPFPEPPAVNVLLLDSLNTRMESQSYVHKQAVKFLSTAKPGSRMAVFTMGLGLHFVQGFTDDPTRLYAAVTNKENNEVQASVMLKGQDETNAQQNLMGMMTAGSAPAAMVSSLQAFLQENDESRDTDRVLRTLANLQRLATFLNGFPGRKNVIWFSEQPMIAERIDPQTEQEWEKTRNMLAAARVALYPVDAGGVSTSGFYQADNTIPSMSATSQMIGNTGAQSSNQNSEAKQRDAEQSQMKRIAEETGGHAFVNSNGLSEVLSKITTESADFYTLSYTPTNTEMDGAYRGIDVRVAGEKYNLSFRRGYFARDIDMPGSALAVRNQTMRKLASENPGAVDPLLPFMDLGMPQSQQILYKLKIVPAAPKAAQPDPPENRNARMQSAYSIDFAIDLKDLDLKLDADGTHQDTLNISMIAYDRYGHIAAARIMWWR